MLAKKFKDNKHKINSWETMTDRLKKIKIMVE